MAEKQFSKLSLWVKKALLHRLFHLTLCKDLPLAVSKKISGKT